FFSLDGQLKQSYMLSPKATERIITEAVEAVKDWQALRVKPEIGRQEMDRFINLF
ncbi:hypothetical protein HMPREF2141_02773, partial [Bacteroides uniformis]